jgi:hypothetical protein
MLDRLIRCNEQTAEQQTEAVASGSIHSTTHGMPCVAVLLYTAGTTEDAGRHNCQRA